MSRIHVGVERAVTLGRRDEGCTAEPRPHGKNVRQVGSPCSCLAGQHLSIAFSSPRSRAEHSSDRMCATVLTVDMRRDQSKGSRRP
jgi:hypothetical protein